MFERLPVMFRSAMYALRGGFLIRPLLIAVLLGAAGAFLSSLEETMPRISDWIPNILFPSHQDPGVAQVILSSIATSIMTVVSIVFAILLMTLTLASTQFSPRILVSFVRDRTTQWTLGVFLGTFSYCMAALPAARALPQPFVPVATVTGAMVLALVCVGWLIYFINHISQSISVNHIVDRIARETELVIEELMPYARSPFPPPDRPEPFAARDGTILNRRSGYIRYIDIKHLITLAQDYRIAVHLERRVGQFAPAGVALARMSKPERVPADRAFHFLAAFDIGPTRTLQQDFEFGVIQIVDIALRAMSPAVNDPSTAISCVDQLSRIIILWTSRTPPPSHYYAPPHVLRLFVPWLSFDGLLDTAFEQIRHYAAADVAVSLRLLRAFIDIASATRHADLHTRLLERARRVSAGCAAHLSKDEHERLQQRLATLEEIVAAEGSREEMSRRADIRHDNNAPAAVSAEETPVPVHRFLNPSTMPPTRGYTHVVETTGPSRTIYIAGQLGMTPDGKFAGAPGDFRAQAVQCFENLKLALAAVGANFEHVVRVTNYFVDIAHLPTYLEVRDRYVNTKAPPASTAIQIVKLAREGALFELEATAVVPEK